MLKQIIDAKDLPEKAVDSEFTVDNVVMLHIYKIRKLFGNDDLLFIKYDENDYPSRYLFLESMPVYNRFGIYLNSDFAIKDSFESILIVPGDLLDDTDAFANFYNRSIKSDLHFTCCIVEKDYANLSDIECENDIRTIYSVANNINVLNRAIAIDETKSESSDISENLARLENYEYIDVSSIFNQYNYSGVSLDKNYAQIRLLCDRLVNEFSDREDVILFIDNSKIDRYLYNYVYPIIAAYLTAKFAVRCEVSFSQQSLYLNTLGKFTSRHYNYFHDYLKLIERPIKVGAYFSGDAGYICIRNDNVLYKNGTKNYRDFSISMSVISTLLDKNGELVSNTCDAVIYDSSKINVLPINEFYHLNSDNFEEALCNLSNLNEIIMSFEEILRKGLFIEEHEALNCSNVILFQFKGQLRLGYVAHIVGELPYFVLPISGGYKGYGYTFSLKEYNNLYDLSILDNAPEILANLQKSRLIGDSDLHYDLPAHSAGVLLNSLSAKPVRITAESNFSVEEIGMWSIQSSQCRLGAEKVLLESITPSVLWSKDFLTFYGGPHPSRTVNLELEADSWK